MARETGDTRQRRTGREVQGARPVRRGGFGQRPDHRREMGIRRILRRRARWMGARLRQQRG
ncbi:MAG TPA: hypothetical protein VFH77_16895 [Streptomyces sp.]|nr:hypothetical protein [Streptomyces sp.]